MTIRPKHVLVAVGMVFVIIGHLGDGTVTREVVFWLGVLMSLLGLVVELRPFDHPPAVHCSHPALLPPRRTARRPGAAGEGCSRRLSRRGVRCR
jgi:hypothetical protein